MSNAEPRDTLPRIVERGWPEESVMPEWLTAARALLLVLMGWYGLASIWTLGVYAWDKRTAVRGRDDARIPERRLHRLALLGGFPGALIAQQIFRHKRAKRGFVLRTWTLAVLHVAVWAGIAWLWWRLWGEG